MKGFPKMLIILDGYGLGKIYPGNAVFLAETPNLKKLYRNFPWGFLKCSGEAVGLPEGQMGNSEVGHLTIGAGRVIYQELVRISKAIEDGTLEKNENLLRFFKKVKENNGRIHILGLLSHGGVHSTQSHLYGLIEIASKNNLRGFVHAILDGRDTPPMSGVGNVKELIDFLKKYNNFELASIVGRYYAMDRDKRWERTKLAYDLYVKGEGKKTDKPLEAIEESYKENIGDEFVKPISVLTKEDKLIKDGDGLLFFNFRADRMRQIVRSFFEENFDGFERNLYPKVEIVTMTQYHEDFPLPVLFPPEEIKDLLGEVLEKNNIGNLRIAETEKYAHVTFFMNGGSDTKFKGEERILVPSPKVATYDLKPEMSAYEVTEEVLKNLEKFPVIVLNFANCDMVGHTGFLNAAIKAVETVDNCLGKILRKLEEFDGEAIITADHGNAEEMIAEDGSPHTAHTITPVPYIIFSSRFKNSKAKDGSLKDIAPTLLYFLDIIKPNRMTGEVLISF
jgi:2,3-bisphosphoglycerate-independent phosphoglycerate mutase